MTAHERNLVRRSERFALVNECKHNMTKKGRFARSFLSTDHPDAKGIVYDYGDCCREVRRMLQKMDAPVREAIRDRRFAEAIKALKDHPALKRTLRTIRRLAGCDEKEIAKALGIKPDTYYKRFDRICEILSISVPRKKSSRHKTRHIAKRHGLSARLSDAQSVHKRNSMSGKQAKS